MKIAFFALNQNFCGTILEELRAHHTLKNYRPLGNAALDWANIKGLIDWADLVYCDFVQSPCPEISQMQWMNKPFVARMDGMKIEPGRRYIVNVGSVGQPRDHNPRACLCVCDLATGELRIERVEYDIEAAQKRILDAGLPAVLANRLSWGE